MSGDAEFIDSLRGGRCGFVVFVTVTADPSQPEAQQIPDRARQAVDTLKRYIINDLEGHDEPFDKQLPELMDWTVLYLPAADETTIRAISRSHVAKLKERRDPVDDGLVERMCLVVDDNIVESIVHGPELDDDDEYEREKNGFVEIFHVDHPPGTVKVVAQASRLPDSRGQIVYEGWMKSTPRGLFFIYRWVGFGDSPGELFFGPSEIHDH